MAKAGTLLILEHGSYSAFAYAGPFRVLKDFSKEEAFASYAAEEREDLTETAFVAWLARAGLIEDVNTDTWYLGDYDFAPLDWVPAEEEGERTVWDRGYFELTPEAEARRKKEADEQAAEARAKYRNDPLGSMTTGLDNSIIGLRTP